MKNPFVLLGVPENADDEDGQKGLSAAGAATSAGARRRSCSRPSAWPARPSKTRRDRLCYHLFQQEPPDMEALMETALQGGTGRRPTEQLFLRVLTETLNKPR